MATYISLVSFTDQGIRSIKDSTQRADAVREAAKKFDADMTHLFWTLGKYDMVAIIEAKDDEASTAFGLAIASAGNVRMQTMRAFNRDEMSAILGRLP